MFLDNDHQFDGIERIESQPSFSENGAVIGDIVWRDILQGQVLDNDCAEQGR